MNWQLRQMRTLLLRESWEHRIAIFWAPGMVALMLAALAVWGLFNVNLDETVLNQFNRLTSMPADQARNELFGAFSLLAIFLAVVLAITIPLYLLSSLYEDRKNTSALFWYSMPVSNTSTVLSKLLTALLLMPLVAVLVMTVLLLCFLVFATAISVFNNTGMAISWLLLKSIVQWTLWLLTVVLMLGLWLLPLYAWILLVSAFARAVPLFWAVGVVIGLVLLEGMLLSSSHMSSWLGSRGIPYQYSTTDTWLLFTRFLNYELLFGLLIATVLLAGAVHMRRFTD